MNRKKVLIIGGDAGLGKALSLFFLKYNSEVICTTRKKNDKKSVYLNLKNKYLNFEKFSKQLKNKKFDYVLFIAAITTSSNEIKNKNCTFGSLKFPDFLSLMDVNCYTNLKVFEYLKKKKFLKQNALIVFFSSLAGSIEHRGNLKHNKPFGNLFYRLSKAALNCGVKNLSYDFKNKYTIIALHPGYVKTKSGGKNADYEVSYAAGRIFKTLTKVRKKDNGNFIDLHGKKLKW